MADDDKTQDGDEAARPASGKKRWLLLAGLILGVALVSVGVTLAAVHLLNKPAEPAVADGEPVAEAPPLPAPAIYYAIRPSLTVNFSVRGRQRFLSSELTLMTRESDVISAVELHLPMIRNALVMLIASQSFEDMQTAEGKELLRQRCLQEVQRLLEQEIGKPGIEQVLFTEFVMQ